MIIIAILPSIFSLTSKKTYNAIHLKESDILLALYFYIRSGGQESDILIFRISNYPK